MNTITQMLFWVSNSLLIPNIIILLILFVRALMLLGTFYNTFVLRKRSANMLSGLQHLSTPELKTRRSDLNAIDNTLIGRYIIDLMDNRSLSQTYVDYQLAEFELEAEKDLSTSKLLSKVGPVLGLIGTLISMAPALTGLSAGDIEGMAYNMQIVFATTVVGLVISLVGLVTQQYKQRWYAQELNTLELVSAQLLKSTNDDTQKA
ncbi:MAG: MotA/TolQ/ExbB proton channel family protein [Porphyromonadaceae bacterium]|nr:MotA/TolQ/ExbB proton channel family protein [Porphyromonadaceae bacterium]